MSSQPTPTKSIPATDGCWRCERPLESTPWIATVRTAWGRELVAMCESCLKAMERERKVLQASLGMNGPFRPQDR